VHGVLLALAIAIGSWLVVVLGLALAGRRTEAREVAALIPNLLALFRGLSRDRRVARSSKLLLAIAIVWIASPIDLIPEFVPIAGPLDDAIVAALVLRRVVRAAGRDVVAEHWRGDARTLDILLRVAGVRPPVN
jgi:uncharacterized membrane protein YkvA (DUF1232 family)